MVYSDSETSIQELKNCIDSFNQERGWNKYHTPRDLAISICLEATEMLELFQWKKSSKIDSAYMRENLEKELADVIIYFPCAGSKTTGFSR
jgi:NTP pyrophosphatase (non-canonical NTP hydrolase)